ncbi:hypothetical protein L2E82_20234 [Cichorium intybus]|uniref:Uncharacterized protein n=1 Tax=Cichorium intybus TaxID=13427 RepID=A0ACB9DT66_CICIN|nr:hypothetical protein L2E82_20234 [Cichorium intybus]
MGCFSCFPKEKRQGIEDATQGKKRSMNCFSCFPPQDLTERKKRNMNCFSCFLTQKSTQAKRDVTQGKSPKTDSFSCSPKKDLVQEKTQKASFDTRNSTQVKKDPTQGKKRNRSYFSCFPTCVKKDSTQGKTRNMARVSCFATRWKRRNKKLRRFGNCHWNKNRVSDEFQDQDVFSQAKKNKVDIKNQANGGLSAKNFTFKELAIATKNFKEECLLGEGGFGRVYKGKLEKTGEHVAVKQLDREGKQGNREFLVEIMILNHLCHPHLVNLIGYCAEGDERLLVYEYMPAGSLESHLLDLPRGRPPLDCYGVVLLELITGRRAVDLTRDSEELHLVQWVEPRIKDPRKYTEVVDPLLQGKYPQTDLSQVLAIAAMCLGVNASLRPSMSDVVPALASLVEDSVPSM